MSFFDDDVEKKLLALVCKNEELLELIRRKDEALAWIARAEVLEDEIQSKWNVLERLRLRGYQALALTPEAVRGEAVRRHKAFEDWGDEVLGLLDSCGMEALLISRRRCEELSDAYRNAIQTDSAPPREEGGEIEQVLKMALLQRKEYPSGTIGGLLWALEAYEKTRGAK